MGIVTSKYDAPYKYFPEITQHRELFNQLRLTDDDVGKFYRCFKEIDVDDAKSVNIAKVLIYLKLEKTFFNKRVFSLLDSDGSGELDFGEFLVGVWNYCSIENEYLEQFAFDLYDKDNSGAIDVSEAKFMLKDMYGEEFDRNPRAKKVYQKLSELNTSDIRLPAFIDFTSKHKAMLYPAFALQLSMKKYILGEAFWRKQAAKRLMICHGEYRTMEDIIGVELFQKQKERSSGKKTHPNSQIRDTKDTDIYGNRIFNHGHGVLRRTSKPDGAAADSGRRGSKTDTSGAPAESGRRGSKTGTSGAAAESGRRGSKHEPDNVSTEDLDSATVVGRRGSKIIDSDIRRGSTDWALEQVPAYGRKASFKVLDPAAITSEKGQKTYQRLVSGHHQEKKEKPEVRRHSRSSAIHPTYTTSPGDVHPPRLVNAVNKVMMQKHVTESMKKATQNPKRKTAKEQVWPRRNTHH